MNFKNYFKISKIIAAVKDDEAFKRALKSKCSVIFLLHGDILTIKEVVEKAHQHNKVIFLHFDMIDGFGRDESAVRYIKEVVCPDGIISIKSSVIKWAETYGLDYIYRAFMVDRQSFDSALHNIRRFKIENIEIMPGIIPNVISALMKEHPANYISGGLITTEEQVFEILNSGATACSTSNEELWKNFGKFN
jgi:glycerol uptake operon antiterminator